MKKLFLLLLLCSISLSAQTLTEKWNAYSNRYEFFDSKNQLIGYRQYDQYEQAWKYYEEKPVQQTERRDENFQLWVEVLRAKQAKYDTNRQKLQTAVDDIRTKISTSGHPTEMWAGALGIFDGRYVEAVNNGKYDLSSDDKTTELINWLYSGMNTALSEANQEYSIAKKNESDKIDQALIGINYLEGGYATTEVTDEKYNPTTKQYEVIKRDSSGAKIYLSLGHLYFYRAENKAWKRLDWKYLDETATAYHVVDLNYGTYIIIDKEMKFIVFLENKIGDTYTKSYGYKNLKKDENIKKPF